MSDQEITLTTPFPANKIKTKPGLRRKDGTSGQPLKFISHGLVNERLNQAAPGWTSDRVATHTYLDPNGVLHCAGVELRVCFGDQCHVEAGGPQRQDGFSNEIKNAYSDALKRCAMRFGVALEMWEQLIDAMGDEDYDVDHQTGESAHSHSGEADTYYQRPPQRAPVDSPINFESTRGRKLASSIPNGDGPTKASDRQVNFIKQLAVERRMTPQELDADLTNLYGHGLASLPMREASNYIERMKNTPVGVEA